MESLIKTAVQSPMEPFIVSARKYRPTTFKSVVGQEALTTTLKNAIAGNKLAHAYLFSGPRGVGKTTCARIFAKTINCLNPAPDHEACNACESCVAFNEQRSYNIHELDAASNNGVDDIRSLIDQVASLLRLASTRSTLLTRCICSHRPPQLILENAGRATGTCPLYGHHGEAEKSSPPYYRGARCMTLTASG